MFAPEILRLPVKTPFKSTPDAAANGANSRLLKLKLKFRFSLPETDAFPDPVTLPEPLFAVKSDNVILSRFLLMFVLKSEIVIPLAVIRFAEALTLIFSSFVKSPFNAVVNSISLAEIIFKASKFDDDATRLIEGFSTLP